MLTWLKNRARSYESSLVYEGKLDRRTCIEMAVYDYEMRGMREQWIGSHFAGEYTRPGGK